MIYIFYNKILLRLLVVLCGLGIGLATWKYVALSAEKLPVQGARDALAIVSFLIAGWLVMLIAEVVDQHYMRAFAALCVLLGGFVSHKWIFQIDGPKLITLPDGGAGMSLVHLGFWSAMGIAVLMLLILTVRLVLDKMNYGRRPAKVAGPAADSVIQKDIIDQVNAQGAAAATAQGNLPPIPVDTSPLGVTGAGTPAETVAQSPPPVQRTPAPVKRISGIGGVYLGSSFELEPGEHSIGRQDSSILLASDNQVSRNHAVISVAEDGIATLRDLGSTNGSFVNEQRISEMQLVPGDSLRIGTSIFKVEA